MSDRANSFVGPDAAPEAKKSLDDRGLDLPINDYDIEVIAREHLTNWKSLRPTLGLTDSLEDDICNEHKESQKQKRAFLHKWRDREGNKATYRVFSDAATKVKNKRLSHAVIAMGRRASGVLYIHTHTHIVKFDV